MRVVFIGASVFGLKCATLLPDLPGCEFVGAVTAPARFPISYRPAGVVNVLHADIAEWCLRQGVPCELIDDDGMKPPALLARVAAWKPEAFIVAGWYHLLPRRWRDLAPAYGLHASLLPDYSGGAPLVWAMIHGERETGITFFQLGDGVDSGAIVGQARTAIGDDDTIATLYARIEELGMELLRRYVPALARKEAVLTPQDETKRRVFPQRGPEDGRIDWQQSAQSVYNFIRAQTRPYPGAFTTLRDASLTVWRASKTSRGMPENATPGDIVPGLDVLVAAGDGILLLEEVTYMGQTMKGAECRSVIAAGECVGR